MKHSSSDFTREYYERNALLPSFSKEVNNFTLCGNAAVRSKTLDNLHQLHEILFTEVSN